MNLSEVITELKLQLGLMAITLPFKDDMDIFKYVIENITLKYYSLDQPYYEKIELNLGDLEKIKETSDSTTYILPNVFNNRKILFIRDIEYAEVNVHGYPYYGGVPLRAGTIQDNILANAGNNLSSAIVPRLTFEYKPPRELTLWNVIHSSTIVVEFAFEHDKNLSSIPDTCRESFMELALLDMKVVLYNSLKHYDQIPSAFGSIQLKIDEWASAESERKDLLKQWGELYILDVANFVYV